MSMRVIGKKPVEQLVSESNPWRQAIDDIDRRPDGKTLQELMAEFGWTRDVARNRVSQLISSGKVEVFVPDFGKYSGRRFYRLKK